MQESEDSLTHTDQSQSAMCGYAVLIIRSQPLFSPTLQPSSLIRLPPPSQTSFSLSSIALALHACDMQHNYNGARLADECIHA